ncbi:hypothetical protein L6R52_36165, partial [Myxococcota bacterium]|nr:hypothetical protein [Myxococcota bacterium]
MRAWTWAVWSSSMFVAASPALGEELVVGDGEVSALPTGASEFDACTVEAGGRLVLNGRTTLTCGRLKLSGEIVVSAETTIIVTHGLTPGAEGWAVLVEDVGGAGPSIHVDYARKAEDGEQSPPYVDGTPGAPGVNGHAVDVTVFGDLLIDGRWFVDLTGQGGGEPGAAGGRLSQTPACQAGSDGGDGAPGGAGGNGGSFRVLVHGRIAGREWGQLDWAARGGAGSDGGGGGEGGNGGFSLWESEWNPETGEYDYTCTCGAGAGADGGDGAPPGAGGVGGNVVVEADEIVGIIGTIDVSGGDTGWEAGCEGPRGRAGQNGSDVCSSSTDGSVGTAAPSKRGGRGGRVDVSSRAAFVPGIPTRGLWIDANGGDGGLAGLRWGYVDQLDNGGGLGGNAGQIRVRAPEIDQVDLHALGGDGGRGLNGLNRTCSWDSVARVCRWSEIGDGGDGASGGSGGIIALYTDREGERVTYGAAGGALGAGGTRGRPTQEGPYGAE